MEIYEGSKELPIFKPKTLTITFESFEEISDLYLRLNLPQRILCEYYMFDRKELKLCPESNKALHNALVEDIKINGIYAGDN